MVGETETEKERIETLRGLIGRVGTDAFDVVWLRWLLCGWCVPWVIGDVLHYSTTKHSCRKGTLKISWFESLRRHVLWANELLQISVSENTALEQLLLEIRS